MDKNSNVHNSAAEEILMTSGNIEPELSAEVLSEEYHDTMEEKEIASILQTTAACFSKTVVSRSSMLVERSNDAENQEKMEEILPAHFYSLGLSNIHSVVIFLLLNYFLLKREKKDSETVKQLYEDHVALLKERNAELEVKLKESKGKLESHTSELCEDLQKKLESHSIEYSRLKRSYEEVCHINEQWALDYEALAKQISNATGFHSVASPSFTSSSSTTTTSSSTSSQAPPTHHAGSNTSCVRCSIYESQLDDKNQETDSLRATIAELRGDIKDCKEDLNRKHKEMQSLESEYQILRLQIQELGDLQLALNMKQEYRKMQRSLQQKNRQYQDVMCEKLELQKQVEKLRQAFLKFFPSPPATSSTSLPLPTHSSSFSTTSMRPLSGSYYSFPLHSCHRNIHQTHHTADPNPPTPPGLLARGDLHGGHVEKDEHLQMPMIHFDNQPSKNTHSLDNHDNIAPLHQNHSPHTNSSPSTSNSAPEDHVTRHTTNHMATNTANIQGPLNPNVHSFSNRFSELTVSNPSVRRSSLPQYGQPGMSHSSNHIPHSGMTSFSSSGSSMSHSNTSIPRYSTSLSSLGYASNETTSSTDTQFSNHTPYPRSKSSQGSYSSTEMEMKNARQSITVTPSKTKDMTMQYSSSRPNFLSLREEAPINNTGASGSKGSVFSKSNMSQQASFSCPNCKKTFSYNRDTFDPWFEHIRYCNL